MKQPAPKLISQPIHVMTGLNCSFFQLSGMWKQLQKASTSEALSWRTREFCQRRRSSTFSIRICHFQLSRCRHLVKTRLSGQISVTKKVAQNGQTLQKNMLA